MEEQKTQTPSSDDGLKKIYNKNVEWGYKGTFDQFSSYFNENDDNKRKVYDFNVKNGYKGSYDDFVSFAGAGQPSSPTDYTSAMGFKQPVGKQESLPIGIAAPKQEPDYSAIMSPQSISALDTPPMEAYRKRQERKRNEDYARSLGLEKTKEQPQEEPQQGFNKYLTKQEDKRADQQAFEDYTREAVEEANQHAELPSQWDNPITPEGRLDKMKRDAVKAEKIEKHNEALTQLAEQNGINLSNYDNLAEAGEEMRKLYDLTPSGKQDKEALERSVQLAQQDFINDYIKNGTDEELKAWLMAGETAEALRREGNALQREARYFNGTAEQAADLDRRIKDFEKKAERHNALLGKDMTQRFSEAFAPFLEKDEYYQATADKYNRNLAASTNPLYMKVTEPVRKQMADTWLAELTTELEEGRPNWGNIREFAAAADILKDTRAFRNAANKNGLSTGLRSAYNALADWGNVTWGVADAANQATVNDVMKKLDKEGYDKLKPAEQALVDAVAVQDLVQGLYNGDVNQTAWGMGETTAQMAQFIAELYVSGGLAGAARGAVKGGVKQGIKGIGKGWAEGWKAAQMSRQEAAQLGRIANKYTNKSALEIAKNIGKKALKVTDTGLNYALTTGAGHSVTNTLEYMAPELDFDYDFNTGEATYNGAKGGDRLGIAALKGFGKQAIEGGTEVMGDEFFEPLVERGGAWLMRALGKGGRNTYKPYLRVVDDWVGGGVLKNIQGYGIEYGEELAGSVLRAITGISSWDEEFNKENLAQTAYGLMPAQIGFAMLGGGRMVGHNRRASRARALMEKYAPEQQDFYNRVAEMSTYDGADMLDRRTLDILETIDKKRADGSLTKADEQKAAAELGMIFATQEQLYMDEAAAYMDDKKQRSIYEGIASNINKDNGKFTVANWTHDGQTERVAVLSTKDGKATIKANGKKHTVDAKDISVQAEYTPEQAVELAAVANEEDWRGMANEDQTTPRAGSIYYDAEGNTPIVPGGGRVMVTEVADNGDVTFETEAGRQQTMSRRQFYDYMRALRENYEDTAGEIEAWQTSETEVANTTAQSDNAMEHQVAGQAARDVERLLAQKIGADQVALLSRMDVEGITRAYLEAEDDTTRSLISAWLQTRTGTDYHNAMAKRKQDAVAGFKQSIGRLAYDNSGITIAEHNGNTVAVESNDGSNAVVIGLDGSKTMVPSASLANMQPSTLDAFAEQAVAPQLQQADALEKVYDGTVFNEGQVYDMGIDKDGKPRKVAVVSVNPDGTISYATNYGWNKDGSLKPDSRSVEIVSAEDFRDMIETANEEAVEKAEGERQSAQQRADMGSLKAGQRVVIMDGGKPVGGVVMIPYTGQQAVFTDTQKLVNFDTMDDLKKSIQDADNATNTQQQAAVEAVANRINELANAMPNARIKVVTDINELRPDAQEFAKQGRLEAYFDPDTNTVVFYAPGLVTNNSNVDGKVIHEVVIHYGLKNMLGEKDYAALCLNIFNNVMDENDRAQYVQYVKDTHPNWQSTLTDEQIMAMAADEWLAFTYENSDIDSIKRNNLLQTIVNFIVDFFKKAGVDLNRDEVMAELDQLVAASRDWLRGEQVNKEEKKEEAPKEEEKKEEPQPEPTKTREELIANAVQAAANFAAQGDPNFVKDNLDKAKKRVSNVKKRKPTSTDPAKRQEQIEKINTELAAAENELAFWNDVQAVINEAQLASQTRLNEANQALQDLDGNLNPTIEAEEVHKFDKEPANADEAAADFLVGFVKKEHRINEQSLMQETGWSEDEVKNFRPATTPDGGMTLQEAAENLYNEYESEGSEHGWFKDPSEARDKLISVMQEAGKYGELANYINQRRGNDEATQQMQAALDANAQQLGYADAQDMHDKRMAEAQAKLEELKDQQGNLSEEALQQFKDFTQGLMIGQEETPAEQPTESIEEGGEYYQPTNEEAPFSVVAPIEAEEAAVRYSIVTDPKEIERLDNEPHEIGYRTVILNEDGTLGSPMATSLGKKGTGRAKTSGFEFGRWEQADEHPELATDNGKIDLIKDNNDTVGGVDYNPYIHIRPNLVNKQFKQAWERPNLVYVRTQYPASELTSGYKADKAKKSVGRHDWNGGELILSRWDKPVEIVPWEEVADDWMQAFGDKPIHFDIIPPQLLPILAERGANIVAPHKNMGKACNDAYNEWKNGGTRFSVTGLITNEQGEIDYDRVTNLAKSITQDNKGSVLDGQGNDARRIFRVPSVYLESSGVPETAAAIIARGDYETVGAQDKAAVRVAQMPQAVSFRRRVRSDIESWAKDQGYWFDDERLTNGFTEIEGGTESRVFEADDKTKVRKLTSFTPAYSDYMQRLVENIGIFNTVFPESRYDVVGFGQDKDGNLALVVEQPLVDGYSLQDYAEQNGITDVEDLVDDIMERRGFLKYGYGTYTNGEVYVSDIIGNNILLDSKGQPYIIDAVTSLDAGAYSDPFVLYSVVTPQQDADYMDAVNRGDMETAQRMVLEAAKAAMPNTKVVDENGNPLVVYRGTRAESPVRETGRFRSDLIFTSSKEVGAKHYGEPLALFINSTNPAILDYQGQEYDARVEDEFYEAGLGFTALNRKARNAISKGYDGLIVKNVKDGTDYNIDEYIVENGSQIKSADPVTYDDQGNVIPLSERFNPNNNDIRYSISPESQAIFDKAKEIFGTTSNINEAGYILPDGAMLDFSGRHALNEGDDDSFLRGERTSDHRDIGQIEYEKDGNTPSGVNTDMPDFIRRGAIRIDSNAGVINLAVKPTQQQRWPIRRIVEANDGDVQVDFGDGWDSDHYVEYDGAKPSRVLADIDRYFDEGVKPEGNAMFSVKKSEKDIADKQLSLFLQNNSGEYETQDGQTIGFTTLPDGDNSSVDSGARPSEVQRENGATNPTDYHLRKLEPGETCHVERRYVETQGFDFTGSEKIETTDDVAYIFKQLENAAIENSFVVLIKDGTPTVIHTGIGTYDQTIVNLNNAMVAYQKLNPDKVYFVHNHPSGNIVASNPDKRVYANAKKLFGDKLQPGIIIDTTSGLYGIFTDTTEDMDNVIPKEVKNETPIKTYSFSKQVFEEDWKPSKVYPIKSSNDVATFVSSHRLGEHKKMSLLILTPQHNVIGNIFLPYTSLSEAPQGIDFANEVGYYINQMGGVTAILYGNFRFDSATIDKIKELKDGLKIQGLNLTDCIHISPTGDRYKSAIEARLLSENEAKYGMLNDAQREAILSSETEASRDELLNDFAGDPVLYSVAKNANTPQERMALYDALVGTKNETSTFVGRTMENAYQYILDGAIPLKRLQDVIAGRGKVTDAENAYLMEIARASRAKYLTDQAEKKYMQQMMDAIADLTGKQNKRGFYKAMRDVELYVLAKSGLERNQWFWDEAKKKDPKAQLEDKSGLTALAAQFGETDFTAFAERLVAEYEAKHGKQKIDNLWNAIRNMSHNILDTERDGMLISAELCEDLKNRWQYYVPMRGFDEDVTSSVYSYDPSSANIRFENPFKKIKGRVSLADNPFVNLWRMTESAINLKGKNEVGLALLTLASNHPDNGLLRVGKSWETRFIDPNTGEEKWMMAYPNLANVSQKDIPAAIDAFQKSMVRMAKTGDARQSNSRTAGGMRIFPTDMDQHTLKVTVAGQSVDLYLMGNPKAFQSLNPNGKNRTAQAMSALTRGLSGLMTTYNPVFMVRNSIRDLGTAMIITYTRDGAGGMATMLGQWFGNANKLRKLIKGKSSGDATIDQYWNEFLEFGGETGFTRSLAMEKARDEFMKDMRNATRKGINPNLVFHAYGNWMENYGNRFAEDITRFAVFCASRKNSKSAMQAAADAKNTTANFNKKGNSAFTRFMTSNFAFFNAALQGLNTTFHAYKDNPGRAAVASVSTMAFSMALPFINMLMLAAWGDDDDWLQYENMTQFIGNTHLVVYIPKAGFATLPFPQDFVPLTALGNIIWRNASGFSNIADERSIAGNIMLEWASTMADLLPVNMFEEGFGKIEDWEGVARAVAPTWLSPVADVMLNRNFMGSMIRRKHFLANGQKDLAPYWAEYDRNKSEWAYELAKLIAGGDEYRAAAEWRNVDPRQIIHIVEGYGGGTVKLISDAVNYATARAKGENASINQSPFIKKFWIQPQPDKYEGNLNGKLYEMAKHQRDMEQELKSLQKEADKAYDDGNDALAEKREKEIERIENSIEYQVLSAYDVNGMMESWREQRNDITADEELSDEGKQEQIRSLTYEKAAFLDGIWEELFLNGDKSNWFSEFYYDKKKGE